MDKNEILKNYYSRHNEDGRLLSRLGNVEFLTTVSYIEKYLKKCDKIIEIGAGTGRYSHYFARQGYEVDAIELIDCNIEVFNENTQPGENITVTQGDAVDLKGIESEKYDITLLLGPMYHLFEENDERAALSEALRVTKKGGVVFAAYVLNEMTVMNYMFAKNNIETDEMREHIRKHGFICGKIIEKVLAIYRIEDVDKLMSGLNVEMLHRVGTDMFSGMIRPMLDSMSDEAYKYYVDYIFSICERPDMIGLSGHLLDVFKKV